MQMQKSVSTRDEILKMLKTKGRLPVSEMAQQLGITEMAVRRHLNTLERDLYIDTELIRQAMGRPTNVYYLTEKGHDLFPKNYSDIALDFLKEIEEIDGLEKVEQLFSRREEKLESTYAERMQNLAFEDKVKTLADIQNNKGYMVEWSKTDDGEYVFKEYNCPISEVAKEYNQACQCELSLFKKLLGTEDIQRTECLAKGGTHCVYIVKKNLVKE
ncbi:helix-turn-helix transcriptional regulator [Bacillus horti]|uniref:ArsR family transcriptional regulator n=1 Tax=Caldalkalibacillus horti TaxID=77523 RepID=A0ABT9VTV3_9BACI|nr:metalloregulator ArsR/SmtB family transcription factor [Bacillus horti]MDQ0164411.1 putative ArsR family transcriptional regulator [Bacillus horti]